MADRHFAHLGDAAEQGQIVHIEIVSRVDPKAEFNGVPGRRLVAGQGRVAAGVVDAELGDGVREGAGKKLNPVGADFPGEGDLLKVWVHEQADAGALALVAPDLGDQRLVVAAQIEAVVGGELIVAVGNQGGLLGPGLLDERVESGIAVSSRPEEWIALNVELDVWPVLQQVGECKDIVGANVPLVGTGVHRDAVRPRPEHGLGCGGHTGRIASPGIAQQRHLVEVDA